jgi:hypothetical protein
MMGDQTQGATSTQNTSSRHLLRTRQADEQ